MARPRQTSVSLEDTPYYHGCASVVLRTFLCRIDNSVGDNFGHCWCFSRQQAFLLSLILLKSHVVPIELTFLNPLTWFYGLIK
jgi:hypothetical protein